MSETLVLGRPRPSRSARLVAIALLVALAWFWVVSERRSDHEQAAVASCSRGVVAAVDRAEKRLAALASYIAPAVDSSSYRTFEGLYGTLSADAERSLPRVRAALERCRGIKVWWLHRSIQHARSTAVALGAAEVTRLESILSDGTTFHDGYDVIARLRREAP